MTNADERSRAPFRVLATVTRRPATSAAVESHVVALDFQFRSRESASYEAQELHDRLRAEDGVISVLTLVMPAMGGAGTVEWQAVWPEVA